MGTGIYENCYCCGGGNDCPCCTSGTPKTAITVTFTGVVNNGCGNCANYNSSFVLNYVGGCLWRSDPAECDHIIELFLFDFDPGCIWELWIYDTNDLPNIDGAFSDNAAPGDRDCDSLPSLFYNAVGSANIDCDWSGATATLS